MRGNGYEQLAFDFGLDDGGLKDFDAEWESSAEKEKQSQTMFAQRTIHPDEVKEAMDAARRSLGEPGDVSGFVADALTELGALLTATPTGFTADLSQVPVQVTEALTAADGRPVTTYYNDLPAPRHAAVLQRTDPTVTALANYVPQQCARRLARTEGAPAKRAGILTTSDVEKQTVALLMRFRTHLVLPSASGPRRTLAEEARVVAFRGRPSDPEWLTPLEVEQLLAATPTANTPADVAVNTLSAVISAIPAIQQQLGTQAKVSPRSSKRTTFRCASRLVANARVHSRYVG